MDQEHCFFYDKKKCFLYGFLLVSIGFLFRPFQLLLYGGAGGFIIAILTFWWELVPGMNYFLKCLTFAPALRLAPSCVEIDSFYRGRQQMKWHEIKEMEYQAGPGAPRMWVAGIPVRLPFPMEENHVIVKTYAGQTYKIRLDALKIKDVDLEQLLRDYKRIYYFQSK